MTDIASWQAVVSQGWLIYSVFCEQERCRFNPPTPTPSPPLNLVLRALEAPAHRLLLNRKHRLAAGGAAVGMADQGFADQHVQLLSAKLINERMS